MIKKCFSRLWGAVLAFAISLSGVMCIVTSFSLSLQDIFPLVLICAGFAVVGALLQGKWLSLLPAVLLAAILALRWESLWSSLQSLLHQISSFYNRAYGWPVFPIDLPFGVVTPPDVGAALGALAALAQLPVFRTVFHKRSCISAVAAGLLLLAPCLVVTDTPPAVPWLMLLLLSILVLLLSSTVRRQDLWQGTRLAVILLLPVALVLGLLLHTFPQDNYRFQNGLQSLSDLLQEWFPLSVGPGLERQSLTGLRQFNAVDDHILDVRSNVGGSLYLRGAALDTYSGTDWEMSGISSALPWPEKALLEPNSRMVQVATKAVEPVLYTAYYSDALLSTSDRTLNTQDAIQYSYSCSALDPGLYAGQSHYSAFSIGAFSTMQLPEETVLWAAPMAEQITAGSATVWDRANAIISYVRSSAEYSLTTVAMPLGESDFAKWFLESDVDGFCVHYATAAAVLLRASGIPARYVTGYLVDTEAQKWVSVTSADAHAWVEVYVGGIGWIPMEPTPYAGEDAPPTQATETSPDAPTEPVLPSQSTSGPEDEPTETTSAQTEPSTAPTVPSDENDPQPDINIAALLPFIKGLCTALTVLGILWGQWWLRLRLRRYQLRKAAPNRRAVLMYAQLLRLYRHLRQTPAPELEQLAQKARFSQHTITGNELGILSVHLRKALLQLRKKPLPVRLFHRLILALY